MFIYDNINSRIVSNGRDVSCRDHSNSNDAPSKIFRKHNDNMTKRQKLKERMVTNGEQFPE